MIYYKKGRTMLVLNAVIIALCTATLTMGKRIHESQLVLFSVLSMCVVLGIVSCYQIVLAFSLFKEIEEEKKINNISDAEFTEVEEVTEENEDDV